MSGDPTRDDKPWRAAVVVFVEVPDAGDQRDADVAAFMAVQQALAGERMRLPAEAPLVSARGRETVQIVDVMDLGTAAGNGHLQTRPASKAFRKDGES